jgi:hypothetical protein
LKYFKDALSTKDFVITSEIFMKPETDANSIKIQADVLRDYVDAILLTDNQSGQYSIYIITKDICLYLNAISISLGFHKNFRCDYKIFGAKSIFEIFQFIFFLRIV